MSDEVEVLIVSGLATVRAGLSAVLATAGGVRVVGQFATLDSDAAADLLPAVDVVLLDAPSALEVDEAALALDGAGSGLVVLGPPSAAGRLGLAGPAFAWAFLARDAEPGRIVAAVRAVAAGLVVLDPEVAGAALGSQT